MVWHMKRRPEAEAANIKAVAEMKMTGREIEGKV